MKQILVNFIKNAIEACQEVANGKVVLSLKTDGRQARLWIRDNGVRMNAFSYEVIRALGGEVSVESQPGAGTLFTLTIPEIKAGDGAKAERKS